MILPKYKFDKIKPYLRNSIPTGLYVLMRNQYNMDKPMELEEYIKLIRQYCTDSEIENVKNSFKRILKMDIEVNGTQLPFIKDRNSVNINNSESSDNRGAKTLKYKHKVVTNFSSNIENKSDHIDNKKIEKMIKNSIKPEEIDIENNLQADNSDLNSSKI